MTPQWSLRTPEHVKKKAGEAILTKFSLDHLRGLASVKKTYCF